MAITDFVKMSILVRFAPVGRDKMSIYLAYGFRGGRINGGKQR